MDTNNFKLHDVSEFPIVTLCGRDLPQGYGPEWVEEMERLLAQDTPFAFVFPNSAENETHDDQVLRMKWLKANKDRLAAKCVGIFSVEPNKALRLMKRAQGLAIAVAFGLRFRILATPEEAHQSAALAVAGAPVPDDAETE